MSHFGVPQAEIVDSLMTELCYCSVVFSTNLNNNKAKKVYNYKFLKSQMQLAVGDCVVVERVTRASSHPFAADADHTETNDGDSSLSGRSIFVNAQLARVTAISDEIEYGEDADTFSQRIGWVIGVVSVDQALANVNAERDLWLNIKRRILSSRRDQIVKALVGDMMIESPLIGK